MYPLYLCNTSKRRIKMIFHVTLLGIAVLTCLPLTVGCGSLGQRPWHGPAATWQSQIAAAQEAAIKIDKSAVLDEVHAFPIQPPPRQISPSSILKVQFIFVRLSGNRINITLEDTQPVTILESDPNYDAQRSDYVRRLEEPLVLQQRATRIASVQLSPREVLQKTLQEGLHYSKQHDSDVMPNILMLLREDRQQNYQASCGTSAVWSISYSVQKDALPLYVCAETGEMATVVK